jgi:hypothetical protein
MGHSVWNSSTPVLQQAARLRRVLDDPLGKRGVLLRELGKVIQAACCTVCEMVSARSAPGATTGGDFQGCVPIHTATKSSDRYPEVYTNIVKKSIASRSPLSLPLYSRLPKGTI